MVPRGAVHLVELLVESEKNLDLLFLTDWNDVCDILAIFNFASSIVEMQMQG